MTKDETIGWHHQLSGHDFEQALGDGEGQASLLYCCPWGDKQSDITEQMNSKILTVSFSGLPYPLVTIPFSSI